MMKSSMSKIETNDVMVGPVVSEGGRSPSTLSPGHGGVGQRGLAPGQRWSVGRARDEELHRTAQQAQHHLALARGPLYRLEQRRQKAHDARMAPSRSAKWILPRANCPPLCSGSAN